jgi:hypothetical protein
MATKKLPDIQTSTFKELKEETPSIYATEERVAALEAKINSLIEILNSNPNVTSKCPKDSEGNRQISL